MTEAAVFDLDDRPIREVMTPRPAVAWLDADDTPDEHRRTALRRPSGAASHASRWAGEHKMPSTRKLPGLRVELPAAECRLWRAAEAAGRKPAWLQDGQVDQDN